MSEIEKYPSKFMPLNKKTEIKSKKILGLTAPVYIREIARKISLYSQKIECEAQGKSKDSKKISINNLGRWLFGVPGYNGHCRIVSRDKKITIYYPKESPENIHIFINLLKKTIEEEI